MGRNPEKRCIALQRRLFFFFFHMKLGKNERVILLFMQIKKEDKVFHYEETNLF